MGLGNQGALASWGNWLFAVNAGTNTITTFWLDPANVMLPTVKHWVSSGGVAPRSLTVWGDWLFVLNSDSIVGFRIWPDGSLTMVPNSMQWANTTGNVEIQFSHGGKWLVVTMRGNMQGYMVYGVNAWGATSPGWWMESTVNVPFGFEIDEWDRVFVAEVPTNALSSWQLWANGTLSFINRTETWQLGTCWATLSPNGKWAYTGNAGSNSVSGFQVDHWAHLWPVTVGGDTASQTGGTHTQDLATSADGKYLYVLQHGAVTAYWIQADGSLQLLSWWTNTTVLPASVTGLIVPHWPAKAAPAGGKTAILGGVVGGVGMGAAIFIVRRRRRVAGAKPIETVAMNPTKTVIVHV